jgi:hypothetical protein
MRRDGSKLHRPILSAHPQQKGGVLEGRIPRGVCCLSVVGDILQDDW